MPNLGNSFRKYQFHLLLLGIGLVWISVFDHLLQLHLQTYISHDALSYQQSAENLYVYHRGHNYRPMLMAALTGIPYLFGGGNASVYLFSYGLNWVCWLGSILVLFEILRFFLKPKFAFVFTLASIFLVGINALVFELCTEIIYLFLILSAVYFLFKYQRTEVFKYLAFALSLLVLSMLIKPGSKFLAILLTVYFVKQLVFNYGSRFAWLLYGSYFLVLVQCAGVKYQFGNFTLGYIDAVTYYDYLGAKAESLRTNQTFETVWKQRADYIYSLPNPEQKVIASRDFTDQLQYNTAHFFRAYFYNLGENASTGSVKIAILENLQGKVNHGTIKTLGYTISEWQNRLLSIVGFLLSVLLLLRFKSTEKPLLVTAFFVIYIMLLSGISCNEGDRFHIVTFPFVLMLISQWSSRKIKGIRID
ncbi:hypothetical protein [Flavobacterium sp.]|uniref:hypothetical protein n=1 Tax=Flavobacterium sp. TaxID=239 RepID=UPI0039E727EA